MASDSRTAEERRDGQPICVVVADDDPDMREEVADTLRKLGHLVIELGSGDDLLRYLRGSVVSTEHVRAPDLIVSDIRMPGPSGLAVLEALREIGCETPVILMTAFGDAETHERASELGAVVTLDKPFDTAALHNAVLDALRAR